MDYRNLEQIVSKASLSTMWAIGRFDAIAGFIGAAHDVGFDEIELNHQVTAEMLQDVLVLRLAGKVMVSSVHAPVPKWALSDVRPVPQLSAVDEDERRLAGSITRQSIAMAARLRARAVVLHCGRVEIDLDLERRLRQLYGEGKVGTVEHDAAMARLTQAREKNKQPHLDAILASLKELAGYAAAMGLRLGLENRFHYYEIPLLDEMQVLLSQLDSATVFYWHDTGHAQNLQALGFLKHEDWLRAFGDRMLGIHLHDTVGILDHRVAGSGEIDFRLVKKFVPKDALRVCEFDPVASADDVKSGYQHLKQLGFF
ncbi:MAG: TIM barrel protein [Chloroflexi bacterium]|nr:TIM barrel protein [Chloroflexota bacterium]